MKICKKSYLWILFFVLFTHLQWRNFVCRFCPVEENFLEQYEVRETRVERLTYKYHIKSLYFICINRDVSEIGSQLYDETKKTLKERSKQDILIFCLNSCFTLFSKYIPGFYCRKIRRDICTLRPGKRQNIVIITIANFSLIYWLLSFALVIIVGSRYYCRDWLLVLLRVLVF